MRSQHPSCLPRLTSATRPPAGPVLAIRPYTNSNHYWQVYFDTNRAIIETFREAAYPTPETPLVRRAVP